MSPATQPNTLRSSDQITIVAPAGPVDKTDIQKGLSVISFPTQVSNAIYLRDGYFAGSHEIRYHEFQKALDTPSASAILCARGGFGSTLILDSLSFNQFTLSPKWIIGSSDITAILLHLWATYQIKSIHGPMANRLAYIAPQDAQGLHDLLTYGFDINAVSLTPRVNGTCQGPLIGGNLTIIAHMLGTLKRDFGTKCILFLEDVTETPYRIERCLVQLRRSNLLSQISGVVLGDFTRCDAALDGVTVEQVLHRNLVPLNIPVATGYPAAHSARNRPFIHGQEMELKVTSGSATLTDLQKQ